MFVFSTLDSDRILQEMVSRRFDQLVFVLYSELVKIFVMIAK